MLTAFIRHADGRISTETTQQAILAALNEPNARFWLDMTVPTDDELDYLDSVFGFHPLAIEDSVHYSQRPKIEMYRHAPEGAPEGPCPNQYFYMVIHGPDLDTFREHLRTKELDIFLSSKYIVTIHEEKMYSVGTTVDRCKADPAAMLEAGIDHLLYEILDRLVDHYEPIFDYLGESIDELEDAAVENPMPALLPRISQRKRELLSLRRVIGPQREVVAQLTRGDVPFVREATRVYFRDVLDHLNRAVETIELYRDLVVGARDIYMSSVSNNLNQVMKTLTIITVTAIPLTVFTSFFGQNFDTPEFKWLLSTQAGFWGSIFVAVALIAGLLALFRVKKWL